jgi:CO/xanthine dehydrogenase Mo-binding subunit
VLPEGRVELVMGTMSSGQGHETSFSQLVTEWLGVPFESVSYFAHDTDRVSSAPRNCDLSVFVNGAGPRVYVPSSR